MIALSKRNSPYSPVLDAKGEWWHWVAAMKSKRGEIGAQFSLFRFGQLGFAHGALLLLGDGLYHQVMLPMNSWMYHTEKHNDTHRVTFCGDDFSVRLWLEAESPPRQYPSKDRHFGNPRMKASGIVALRGDSSAFDVCDGTACFDREIFHGKKLLPGETGWEWTVAWLNDGSTVIDYHYKGENPREPMHYGPRMKVLTFDRIGPKQEWKRGEHLAFSYTEELCRVTGITEAGEPVFGRGYREIVGYDGAINI